MGVTQEPVASTDAYFGQKAQSALETSGKLKGQAVDYLTKIAKMGGNLITGNIPGIIEQGSELVGDVIKARM